MWWATFISAIWLLFSANMSFAQERGCTTGGKTCVPDGYVGCANGNLCPANRKCSADGRRCLAREMTDCGGYSCGPGKSCGADNKCVVKDDAPSRPSPASEGRRGDMRLARRATPRSASRRPPAEDRTLMEIKAFIEARANGAPPESPPAAPAPARQEPRLNLEPAHNDARPEAKPIDDRRGPASTASAIDDLQAEIKKAQENRLRLDQEIKQLQTKMETLSLKKWQEHAGRYDEARAGDPVPLTAGDKYEKLSCRLVDPLIGNAARLRLDCEWKLATSNPATPAGK